jgi:hypothetical protein
MKAMSMNLLDLESLVTDSLLRAPLASQPYDESVFRHLLGRERVRAGYSNRSLFVLLVTLKPHPTEGTHMPAPVASAIFAGLRLCTREVDVIGWHREARVVGAVLTQGAEPITGVMDDVVERVTTVLTHHVPGVANRIRVRLIRLTHHVRA